MDKGLLVELMELYGIDQSDKDLNKFLEFLLNNLSNYKTEQSRNTLKNKSDFFDLDIISSIYEKNIPHNLRKRTGEFYTPKSIVTYIINSIGYTSKNNISTSKIIDLSCGSGSFLIQAVKILYEKLRDEINVEEVSKIPLEQAMNIIKTIKNNIYGIDINPIACLLCQINIYFTIFDLIQIIIKNNKISKLPKFNILNKDALQLNFDNQFHYVVGNPPYLFIRSIPKDYKKVIESLSLETNKGQFDYYQLFIEKGINTLKKNGKLGYIVPDSLLALSNRKILREYIYNHTKINEICVVASGFKDPVVSNIILVLQAEILEEQRLNNNILIKKALNDQTEHFLKQDIIEKWDYKFLIHLAQKDIKILEHLNNGFPKLKDLMADPLYEISINRGVELGKEGIVIYCDVCNRYFPLPKGNLVCHNCGSTLNSDAMEKIITENIPKGLENAYEPFIYSLNRYTIKEYRYIKKNVEGINYKNLNNYHNRIVVRQLNQDNLICATFEKNALSSQSIYNLKINHSPMAEFNHIYLLGLLNSGLLSYYFLKTFGSYKTLFPRILIEKLKILPIKVPSTKREKELSGKIKEKVMQILDFKNHSKTQISTLQDQIDLIVNNLYKIDENDYSHIIDTFSHLDG